MDNDLKENISNLIDNIKLEHEILSQDATLGQIFSRIISTIIYEDDLNLVLQQIKVLDTITRIIINFIAKDSKLDLKSIKLDPKLISEIKIDPDKLKRLKDDLKTLKKNANKSIITIEKLFNFCLINSERCLQQTNELQDIDDLYHIVFEIPKGSNTQTPDKIENINIKELILMYRLHGEIIDNITQKYDGIITYTMSLLTMLTGTKYGNSFSERLSSLMFSLGTSTQIILISQRMQKVLKKLTGLQEQAGDLQEKICDIITQKELPYSAEDIKDEFDTLFGIKTGIQIELNEERRENILSKIKNILSHPLFGQYRAGIEKIDEKFREELGELSAVLGELEDYLEKIVKKANTITADLLAAGFQAAIPKDDADVCERAGIHIRDIIGTSLSKKSEINEEYFSLQAKYLRTLENLISDLTKLLGEKSKEEITIRTLKDHERIFSKLFMFIQKDLKILQTKDAFMGYREEVIINLRSIKSLYRILKDLFGILQSVKNEHLSTSNIEQFKDVISKLQKQYIKLRKLFALIIHINSITKILWVLNRSVLLEVGKDEKYFLDPDTFNPILDKIEALINREFKQRLISKDKKEIKLRKLEELRTNINEYKKTFSEYEKKLFLPFKGPKDELSKID